VKFRDHAKSAVDDRLVPEGVILAVGPPRSVTGVPCVNLLVVLRITIRLNPSIDVDH
jgi:hypothetical protein